MQCSYRHWTYWLVRTVAKFWSQGGEKNNWVKIGEYVLLWRKSRGHWTVSRGTEIAWAETEEVVVKSELGWSLLWWAAWRQKQGILNLDSHLDYVQSWWTASPFTKTPTVSQLGLLFSHLKHCSMFASVLTNGSWLLWYQCQTKAMLPLFSAHLHWLLAPPSLSHST